jgi:hypothetical protein
MFLKTGWRYAFMKKIFLLSVFVIILSGLFAQTTTDYKVGDTGPAGGIIFYDKGNDEDGWRYLEAAPKDIGTGSPWDANERTVKDTKIDVGAGKANTEALIQARIMVSALIRQYSQGGYNDWFLPSKDELDLMHYNLKLMGLGGFSDNWYWSSSESGDNNGAWALYFGNGVQVGKGYYSSDEGNKTKTHLVRAARRF